MKIEKISEHFKRQELACPCCGQCRVQWALIEVLEDLRARLQRDGAPAQLIVESGYRCAAHNRAVGGAPLSQHTLGSAADVWSPGISSRDLYKIAVGIEGVGGLGASDHRKTLHIDVRPTAALVRWCYGPSGEVVTWYDA